MLAMQAIASEPSLEPSSYSIAGGTIRAGVDSERMIRALELEGSREPTSKRERWAQLNEPKSLTFIWSWLKFAPFREEQNSYFIPSIKLVNTPPSTSCIW